MHRTHLMLSGSIFMSDDVGLPDLLYYFHLIPATRE